MESVTLIFILAVSLATGVELWLAQRQLHRVQQGRSRVPEAFADSISLQDHHKAADYTMAKTRFGRWELIYGTMWLLLWTLGGGLSLLDGLWQQAQLPTLATGVCVMLSAFALMAVIDLPVSAWHTFVIEHRFGFNRTTVVTFIGDLIKQILLMLVLGTPLAWVVLWLMHVTGEVWWLYTWGVWMAFTLLMMWAYPSFIAPLFNRFAPLENGQLRKRIETLLQRCGFASNGIFVVDGSRRSGHGNAYFTGLGRNKRIVFFDTLLDSLNTDEVEAVLAHELGHFKHKHIHKHILSMGLLSLLGLALLGWLAEFPAFYSGLGAEQPSPHMALLLFLLVAPVFTLFLQPLFSLLSRRHEFEADAYAAQQADATHLIHALVKLYRENAATLTPDSLYSAFHDSHPPAPVRIAHLSAKIGSRLQEANP